MLKVFPLFLLVVIASCSSCSGVSSFSSAQIDGVESAVEQVMADTNAPGALVGVWEGSKSPLIVARGKADVANGTDVRVQDKFRIASVTKTFTATVVLQLIDEGVLSLDETIQTYFPEVPNADIITIRALLNMTAGVNDFFYEDPDVVWSYQNEPLRKWTLQELYDILITKAPAFQPGEQCVYSNANYFLLGMLVERVTGSSLAEQISSRIFVPLGLSDTSFPSTPEMTGIYSHGYRNEVGAQALEDITPVDPSLPWAGGAIVSKLHDLKIWVGALYNGTLLSPALQEQRLQWNTMIPDRLSYGLGIMNWSGFIGHNGAILGYNNFSVYLPEKDAVVIVVVNKCNDDGSESPAQDLFLEVTKVLYPDVVPW